MKVRRGFILGVLNMFGTLMSSLTRIIEEEFYKHLGLRSGFFIGFAHSDDMLSFYKAKETTEIPSKDEYKRFLKRLKKDCFELDNEEIVWRESRDTVEPKLMNLLIIQLTVITARYVGLKFGLVKSKMGLKEMLQVCYIDGSWSSAISKFLYTSTKNIEEGDFNTSLLQAATGGIQNLRVQGAQGDVIESTLVLNQLMIYYISGVAVNKNPMMKVPLLGGIYFSHYTSLIKRGFPSYQGYMIKNAIKNPKYRKMLNVSLLNNEIYNLERSYTFKDEDDKINIINHFAKFEVKRPQGNIPITRINPLMEEFINNTEYKIIEALHVSKNVGITQFAEILADFQ
jgi:hypothetical protein